MTIHKAILIQPADKLLVRVWDSPEPLSEEYENGKFFSFKDIYNEWLKSYKEHEVHPAYVTEFMKLFDPYYRYVEDEDLNWIEQGIEIDPSLIDVVCKNCGTNRFNKLYYCCSDEQYRLVKLKDKPVESEVDLWDEFINYVVFHSIPLEVIKQKYTLKRK